MADVDYFRPGRFWQKRGITPEEAKARSHRIYYCELCDKKAWYHVGNRNYCREHKEAGMRLRAERVEGWHARWEAEAAREYRGIHRDWEERKARRRDARRYDNK